MQVAYASSSRPLAMLEVLVHVTRENAPSDYVFVEAEIPDDAIEALDVSSLPKNWQAEPPPATLRAIGDTWARARRSLALCVPSAVIPEEFNLLVNPTHARFAELKIGGAARRVQLDARLLR